VNELLKQLTAAKRDCGLAGYEGTSAHLEIPQVLKRAELALGAALGALDEPQQAQDEPLAWMNDETGEIVPHFSQYYPAPWFPMGRIPADQSGIAADAVSSVQDEGMVLMPREAKFTNEMKAIHIGEYSFKRTIACYGEDGDGCALDDAPECSHCDSSGEIEVDEVVPWDTCKQIFKGMYATAVQSALSRLASN
jgi:hypothetical protein